MWCVQLNTDKSVFMDLVTLLKYFPTLDLMYEENFIESSQTCDALVDKLSVVDSILTEEDTRKKYSVADLDLRVPPSWTQGRQWSQLGPETSMLLLSVRNKVAEKLHWMPNYALVNVYRDGEDEITWHADIAEGVVPNSSIASVSVGSERKFQFRPYVPGFRGRTESWPVISIVMQNGSLLVMGPQTNEFWCHSLPKDSCSKTTRVNITLRCLNNYSGSEIPTAEFPYNASTRNYQRLEEKFKSYQSGKHPIFDHHLFKELQ